MTNSKKSKNLAAGPSKSSPKAPKVDPSGKWTKVQQRTIGSMKYGGKISKKK
jgi:multidrug resistance efflux pump